MTSNLILMGTEYSIHNILDIEFHLAISLVTKDKTDLCLNQHDHTHEFNILYKKAFVMIYNTFILGFVAHSAK